MNAVVFTIVFCSLFFVALYPSFSYDSLYEMGTTVFVGLILSLQLKVAFLHQVWNRIHVIAMIISVGGLFLFLVALNASATYDYDFYNVANKIYGYSIFWFFGVFTIPLVMLLLDICGQSLYVFFYPNQEMIFREQAFGYKKEIRWELWRTTSYFKKSDVWFCFVMYYYVYFFFSCYVWLCLTASHSLCLFWEI